MDKYVIYFAGGTMRGAFGAGVAKAFQDANIYPQVSAIYTASAGVLNGAYFLAKGVGTGATIYWEDLGEKFISKKNFFLGSWRRFQDHFIRPVPPHNLLNVLDIDYLMHVVKKVKPLDTKKIIASSIPFGVKLFDLNTHVVTYVDARRPDIFAVLKAGVNVFPYVYNASVIDGKKYIDAAIIDIIGYDTLRARHPNEKIIFVINGQIDRKFRYRAKNIIEGKFMQWMFDDAALYNLYASAEDNLAKDIANIIIDPHAFLITQEKDMSVQSRTTNPQKLKALYALGIAAGNRALQDPFMNLP